MIDIICRKEYESKLSKMAAEYELRLKNEKEQLKGDHILEMQLMLQEFEKAKNFLKLELANKDKL